MSFGPIIILGMHRSGTTMITKHLEEFGLYLGRKKDENCEAIYFIKLNDWLLKQCTASWDSPEGYLDLKKSNKLKEDLQSGIEFHLSSVRNIEYFGMKNHLKLKTIKNFDRQWGWKDPRNTFTIDIWKDIFPEAKIIHIYRNPIDVAASLRNRKHNFDSSIKERLKKELKKKALKGNLYYTLPERFVDIKAGIDLWSKYIRRALELEEDFGDNFMSIKYEDYLCNPMFFLEKLIDFIGFNNEKNILLKKIRMVTNSVDSTRRFAFVGDEQLEKYYHNYKENIYMKRLGYNEII